jgi:hypothetical protein
VVAWAGRCQILTRSDPDPDPDGNDNGDDQYAYFLCHHRRGTTLTKLIGIAGR